MFCQYKYIHISAELSRLMRKIISPEQPLDGGMSSWAPVSLICKLWASCAKTSIKVTDWSPSLPGKSKQHITEEKPVGRRVPEDWPLAQRGAQKWIKSKQLCSSHPLPVKDIKIEGSERKKPYLVLYGKSLWDAFLFYISRSSFCRNFQNCW